MNIKKVVAAALILSSMTAVSASAAEFNDIKGHWAEDVINELADKDIIHGVSDTEFNPDGTVTRAEFLKMALGTVGIADVPYRGGECLDVTASDWYGGCVQSALDKGLIPENMIGNYAAKITDGKVIYSGFFDGDKPIKREEMAYMVYMLYQYSCDEEESYNILTPVDLQFDDVSQISQWALDGVRYAYTNGLISGMDDDTFRPQQTATRAQAASIISRLLDKTE